MKNFGLWLVSDGTCGDFIADWTKPRAQLISLCLTPHTMVANGGKKDEMVG